MRCPGKDFLSLSPCSKEIESLPLTAELEGVRPGLQDYEASVARLEACLGWLQSLPDEPVAAMQRWASLAQQALEHLAGRGVTAWVQPLPSRALRMRCSPKLLVCLDASPEVCEELSRELERWLRQRSPRSGFWLTVVPLDELTRAARKSLLSLDLLSAEQNG